MRGCRLRAPTGWITGSTLVLVFLASACAPSRAPEELDVADELFAQRTKAEMLEAASLYRQITESHPDSARAWGGLADAKALLGLYGHEDPTVAMPEAAEAADVALSLDPQRASTHASRGLVAYLHEWRFDDAESSFSRAVELEPSLSQAHHWWAMMLSATGRHDEAIHRMRAAVEAEPESRLLQTKLGTVLGSAGRTDEARDRIGAVLRSADGFAMAHREMGELALWDRHPAAVLAFEKSLEIAPTSSKGLAGLATALVVARIPDVEERVALIEAQIDALAQTGFVGALNLAEVRVAAGAHEAAVRELELGFAARDPGMVYLLTRPGLRALHPHPTFQHLVKSMGLRSDDFRFEEETPAELVGLLSSTQWSAEAGRGFSRG